MAETRDDRQAPSSPLPFDLARAFTFFFEDPEWIRKLVVGTLFALLSPLLVGSVFLIGYAVGLARRVQEGRAPELPEWDDFQEIFFDGLRGLAVSLAHKLPVLLLASLTFLALLGGIFLRRSEGSFPEGFMFVGAPAVFGGFVLVCLLSISILVYVPAAFIRFVQTDRVADAFDFTANLDFIRAHLGAYLTGVLAIVLAAFVAQFGLLFCCIGVFPASFWSVCVMGYVMGELARLEPGRATAASGEADPGAVTGTRTGTSTGTSTGEGP